MRPFSEPGSSKKRLAASYSSKPGRPAHSAVQSTHDGVAGTTLENLADGHTRNQHPAQPAAGLLDPEAEQCEDDSILVNTLKTVALINHQVRPTQNKKDTSFETNAIDDVEDIILLPLYLTFSLTKEHILYVENVLRRRPVPDKTARANKHAPAAAERQSAGESALTFLQSLDHRETSRVYEIAGNPTRTQQWMKNLKLTFQIFTSMPVHCQKDIGRRAQAAQSKLMQFTCQHDLHTCTCLEEKQFKALFSVHVVYHLTPQQIANAMVICGATHYVSVEHEFKDAAGVLCGGTLRYHIMRDGQIYSVASGETEAYTHDPAFWRYGTGTDVQPFGRLIRYVLSEHGDTVVAVYELTTDHYEVQIAPHNRMTAAIDTNIGLDHQLTTVVNRQAVTPLYNTVVVPIKACFYLYGLYVITRPSGEVIPIPRGLIGTLRLLATGQKRDAALYSLLLARGKRICGALNMPDDVAADAVIYAAVAAMSQVEQETIALGRATSLFGAAWERHSRVLNLEALSSIPLDWKTGAYIASSLPSLYFSGVIGYAGSAVLAAGALVVAHPAIILATPFVAAAAYPSWSRRRAHLSDEAQAWANNRNMLYLAGPVTATLHYPSALTFRGYFQQKRPDGPIAEDAVLKVGLNPRLGRDTDDAPGLKLYGIGFSTMTPSYIPRSENTAISGLKTRLLADFGYDEDDDEWDTAIARFDDPSSAVHSIIVQGYALPDDPEAYWPPFVERFPGNVQRGLEEAKLSLKERELSLEDYRLEAIVKREKTGYIDEGGPSANDPRIVLAVSARFNALVSPSIYHMSKAIIDHMAVSDDAYCCIAISCSAEQLGSWFDTMTAHFRSSGGCCYGPGDMERYDAKQRKGALKAKMRLLKLHRISDTLIKAVHTISHPRGVVQGQAWIRFRTRKPRVPSGMGMTSIGNSVVTLVTMVHVFGEPGPDTYAVVVNGDDFLLIGKPSIVNITKDELNSKLKRLGLSASYDPTKDSAFVEFVSLLFYPTAFGTVPGPKLGRNLVRGGWTTSSEHADIYGSAVSLSTSVHHIPFLRQYFEAHRQLARPTESFRPHLRLAAQSHDASPETYEFLERRYGLTRADELEFERVLTTVISLPAVINWPRVNELFHVDA